MKITGKIGKIYPQRTGTSKRTGNPFTVTEFHVVWYEENNRGTLTHIQKCSTMQEVDLAKMEKARETLEDLTFNLFFDVQESTKNPGEFFNSVRAFLPQSMLMEVKVES